jgi:hypothetical protein
VYAQGLARDRARSASARNEPAPLLPTAARGRVSAFSLGGWNSMYGRALICAPIRAAACMAARAGGYKGGARSYIGIPRLTFETIA